MLDPLRPAPLGLPRGSVRAILALSTVGTALGLLARERPLDLTLWLVTTVVLGYYFAARGAPAETAQPAAGVRPPLFLPRGTVRWLIFLGFAGTAGYLLWSWRQVGKSPLAQEAFFPLLALGAFFGGRLLRGVAGWFAGDHNGPLYLMYNNCKALLALGCAASVLALFLLELQFGGDQQLKRITLSYIVFYFGSRTG